MLGASVTTGLRSAKTGPVSSSTAAALAYSLTVLPSFSRASLWPPLRDQVFHDVQSGKGVVARRRHRIGIFAAQIVFHIFAGQRRAAADHGIIQILPLQVLDYILHLQRGLDQQAAQADGVGAMFLGGADDHVARLLDPEIDDFVAVVRQDDVDEVLADVVNVAFYRRENDGAFLLRPGLLLHLRLEIGDGAVHHSGGVEHRRQAASCARQTGRRRSSCRRAGPY